MDDHPNTHLRYAEDSSRFSDRSVLEVPQINSLPSFRAEQFDRLEQRLTLIALVHLLQRIHDDGSRDRQPCASRPVPMVVSGKVRNSPVQPPAKLDFARRGIR